MAGAGEALKKELADNAGRLLLLADDLEQRLAGVIGQSWNVEPISIGQAFTGSDIFSATLDPGAAVVLVATELLFAPEADIDPVAWLRGVSRRVPAAMQWPGPIERGLASFSRPGRRDYREWRLTDAIVLRPLARPFPGEIPYAEERIL